MLRIMGCQPVGCVQAQGYRKRRFQAFLLLCTVPWILTPACKANFFKVEAMMQMQRQVHDSSINVRPPCHHSDQKYS